MLSYDELLQELKEERDYSRRLRKHRDEWEYFAMFGGNKPNKYAYPDSDPVETSSWIEILEEQLEFMDQELAKYKASFESVVDECVVNWVSAWPEPGGSFKQAISDLIQWNIEVDRYFSDQELLELYDEIDGLLNLVEVLMETVDFVETEYMNAMGITE